MRILLRTKGYEFVWWNWCQFSIKFDSKNFIGGPYSWALHLGWLTVYRYRRVKK